MQKSELTKTECSHFLKKLCRLLRDGQMEETINCLTGTQGIEGEECEKEPLLSSALLWKGKMDTATKMERYAKSEFLIFQWDDFARALIPNTLPEQFVYALKYFVYSAALKGYLELYQLSGIADVDVLSRLGKIYKVLGNYERAIEALELANQQKKKRPPYPRRTRGLLCAGQ
jgi:tetratricopeptide (TPR) repeat protein